jgi:two-component system LytT family response regulator
LIQALLKDYFPEIEVVASAEGVTDGVAAIEQFNPDILFLDIEIKGGTGFHVLQKVLNKQFKLIFITAFNNFAIQAIKFSAIDYILKPINEFEFKAGVEKALQHIGENGIEKQIENLFANSNENKKLILRTAENIHIIDINEIVNCVSDNSYTTFFLNDGESIIVSKSMKEYEDILKGYGFVRPHQSHLVNLNYVKKIDKNDGGFLILKNRKEIPVSLRRKQALMNLLKRI